MAELNTLSIGNRWLELAKTSLVSDANLQGYWRLEADGTDSSSNGYNVAAGSAPDYVAGKYGNGGDFDAASNDRLTIANASCPNLEITGSQTWLAWYKPETIGASQVIMSKRQASSGTIREIYIEADGGLTFYCQGLTTNAVINTTVNMEAGKWYHVAGVYDSTNSKLKLFLNGTKVNELTASGSATASTGDFWIGMSGLSTSTSPANGIIDDCAIFNRALTDAEILTLCDKTRQGYWRLESDGTDSSGNGYTLTGTAPTYTAGKFGNGGDFETTSSQYITRSEAGLRFNGAKTISCWIKPESLYGDQYFVGLWNSSPNNYYQLKIDSSGGLTFQIGGVSGVVTSDAKVSIGSWYHVVGSWDGTTYSVYVNGTKKSGASGGSELSQDAGGFSIGRTGDYFAGYLDGIIDDIAVFSRALTDAEVRELYAGGGGAFLYNIV